MMFIVGVSPWGLGFDSMPVDVGLVMDKLSTGVLMIRLNKHRTFTETSTKKPEVFFLRAERETHFTKQVFHRQSATRMYERPSTNVHLIYFARH